MFQKLLNSNKGLNGGNLKMIALFCMTIDHLAVALIEPSITTFLVKDSEVFQLAYVLYWVMRFVGRVAFPIYCFFIYEGYKHTRSKIKYSGRLLLLAIISEIPFNLVLSHKIFSFQYQNIFWTLLLGLIIIWELDELNKKTWNKTIVTVSEVLIIASGIILGEVFNTDYGGNGVLAIVIIWLVNNDKVLVATISHIIMIIVTLVFSPVISMELILMNVVMTIIFIMMVIAGKKYVLKKLRGIYGCCTELAVNNTTEIFAFLIIPLMLLYNGKKGRINKWLFYFYYPAHLLLFAIIGILIGVYK